ncbi:MAG: TonB-dependent receptor [Acidobacteria bacterium]|nr:TonB-dependent receptor [Acidobacteriota bacterium]
MARKRCAVVAVFTVIAILAATAGPAAGQVLYGSIVGHVSDPSNAAIPAAAVRVTHKETNQVRSGATNENGNFIFSTLPGGAYEVVISKDGFQTHTVGTVVVAVDQVVRVDAVLRVGAVTESIQVTGEAAALQTDRAEVRTEVVAAQLQNLPVPIGRNYQNLFILVPGITPPENNHSVAANPARGLGFHSNGATRNANSIRIEGAITNNLWLPHVAAYIPGLEAIEAVSVVTGSLDADQGLSGGMSANVQLKSGGNTLHGSLFEHHFDNALKARPYFLPAGQRKPKAINNQLGGTLGGRIIRDKLFYFASYEGEFDRQTGGRLLTVPTAAIRSGNMSASPNPIYDPFTGAENGSGRTPLPGSIVPGSRIDPIVTKLIADLPQPTFPELLTTNFYASGPYNVSRHKTDAKVNFNPTEKLTFSGRLGWLHWDFNNPPAFGQLGGDGVNSAAGKMGKGSGDTYTFTGSAAYVLAPTFVVDTYTGITLIYAYSNPPRVDENLGLDFLKIPGTNGTDRVYGGWPQFSVSNYSSIGNPGSGGAAGPYVDENWQAQYTANASWTKRSHGLRFGGDIVRQALNRFETGASAGAFSFGGGPTQIAGGPSGNQFNSFATFLLGLPTDVSKSLVPFDNNRASTRNWQYSLFFKDQWQVTPRLTASLGVRWDRFPMGARKSRGLERYDFDNNRMLICGAGNVPTDCGYEIGWKNFSPRIGLAYRATDTLVIRTGYGLNFDPYPLAFVRDLIGNYPSGLNLSIPSPNPLQFARRLREGIPAIQIPDISAGVLSIPATLSARALEQKPRRGYVHSWNFTLQKQLWWGLTGQAGYVASRQIRINQILNLNAGQIPGLGQAGQPFFVKFRRTANTELLTNPGTNKYDSLQTMLQRRFAQGVQASVSYTWSKVIGICCDALADNPPAIQALPYFSLNRAIMGFDRTHNFNTSFVVELPFGRGKRHLSAGRVGPALAGGWQVSGLLAVYSGSPFTVSAAGTSLNLPGSTQKADQIKPTVEILGHTGPGQSYFDPLAFAPVTQARFGTSGLNRMRGPGVRNFDFGLFRQFRFSERWSMQFRAEVFNFTNTPHFSNPAANVSNLQLNADGSIRNLGGYSTITGIRNTGREGLDERVFRFGLRFGF